MIAHVGSAQFNKPDYLPPVFLSNAHLQMWTKIWTKTI